MHRPTHKPLPPDHKACRCGRAFSPADWAALPIVGDWELDEDVRLELRNCPCGSTISVELPPRPRLARGTPYVVVQHTLEGERITNHPSKTAAHAAGNAIRRAGGTAFAYSDADYAKHIKRPTLRLVVGGAS